MGLLQMSMSGAVLALAIIVIRAATVNRLPKRTFLILWWIVILRLLIPVSLPSRFSIYSLLGQSGPVPDILAPDSVKNGTSDLYDVLFLTGQGDTGGAGTPALQSSRPSVSILPFIWLAGTAVLACVFLVSYVRCRREFKTSLPVHNAFSDGWLQKHSLRRRVEIRQLTGLLTPLTYGLFRPVILMPKHTDWEDTRQVNYMLFHEYVHICRFDAAGKLAATAALCIHWFNPAVWIFYILFNRDLELACDERVVRHFDREGRAAYARTLICMEERKGSFAPFQSFFAKNSIEERITAIMKMKKTTAFSFAMAAFLVAGTATMFATSAQAESEPDGTVASGLDGGDQAEINSNLDNGASHDNDTSVRPVYVRVQGENIPGTEGYEVTDYYIGSIDSDREAGSGSYVGLEVSYQSGSYITMTPTPIPGEDGDLSDTNDQVTAYYFDSNGNIVYVSYGDDYDAAFSDMENGNVVGIITDYGTSVIFRASENDVVEANICVSPTPMPEAN